MNVIWCHPAMQHHAQVWLDALKEHGKSEWTMLVAPAMVGDVDNVLIVGMYDAPTYKMTLECTKRAHHRIIVWCGMDTAMVQPEYLPHATHLVASAIYNERLKIAGITTAEPVDLPTKHRPACTALLPEQPTVGSYMGASAQKYGGEWVEALAEVMPDVKFVTWGNDPDLDIPNLLADCSIVVQLGNGNGGGTMVEAMMMGRRVIGTYDMPFAKRFQGEDFIGLVRQVRSLLKHTEPDCEAAEFYHHITDPRAFAERIEAVCV